METTTYISSIQMSVQANCVVQIIETTDFFEKFEDGSISVKKTIDRVNRITYGNDISSLSPALQTLIKTFFELSSEL